MPTLYKICEMILGERLKRDVEERGRIPQNQTGFRWGMGIIDNIYVLNYLVNRQLCKKWGKLVAFFVNLRAAFDSVNSEVLRKVMREREVRGGLVRCKDILKDTKCIIICIIFIVGED